MKKILCRLKGHIRDIDNTYLGDYGKVERFTWVIRCKRCGYVLKYESPRARLVGKEMEHGFTGD